MKVFISFLLLSFIFCEAVHAQKKDCRSVLYTRDGVAHEGKFKTTYFDEAAFKFTDAKTGEEVIIDKRDLCCWVVKGDSFTVLSDPTGALFNKKVPVMGAFAVIINGRIDLYRDADTDSYVFRKDGQLKRIDQYHFTEQIASYIGDYPALLNRIKHNQLKFSNAQDDVPAIIKFYNDWAKLTPK